MVLKLQQALESPGGPAEPTLIVSNSIHLGWGLRNSISNKFQVSLMVLVQGTRSTGIDWQVKENKWS